MPSLLIADSHPRCPGVYGLSTSSKASSSHHPLGSSSIAGNFLLFQPSLSIYSSSLETSSKSMTYHQIKLGYACEPYIQQANNSHLRKIMAQFRTGSHWLQIETERHVKLAKQDRTCPMCFFKLTNPGIAFECWDAFDSDDESTGHVEDEHHAIFDCSGYKYARELFQDLFQSHITSISQFLNQPQINKLAKFLTWIRMMRMNKA